MIQFHTVSMLPMLVYWRVHLQLFSNADSRKTFVDTLLRSIWPVCPVFFDVGSHDVVLKTTPDCQSGKESTMRYHEYPGFDLWLCFNFAWCGLSKILYLSDRSYIDTTGCASGGSRRTCGKLILIIWVLFYLSESILYTSLYSSGNNYRVCNVSRYLSELSSYRV